MELGGWELGSEAPGHFRPVGGRNRSSQGGASCQNGRKETKPSEKRFFKKRVMNSVQYCDDVKKMTVATSAEFMAGNY